MAKRKNHSLELAAKVAWEATREEMALGEFSKTCGVHPKRMGIGRWMTYYNAEHPHSTHGILAPDESYETHPITEQKAA